MGHAAGGDAPLMFNRMRENDEVHLRIERLEPLAKTTEVGLTACSANLAEDGKTRLRFESLLFKRGKIHRPHSNIERLETSIARGSVQSFDLACRTSEAHLVLQCPNAFVNDVQSSIGLFGKNATFTH